MPGRQRAAPYLSGPRLALLGVLAWGGIVVTEEHHPAYGNLVEVNHGNDLITRYAHPSTVHVKKGDLVERGQKIAAVGSTGRSTGSHCTCEVMVKGVFQDPQRFLNVGQRALQVLLAATQAPGAPRSSLLPQR